MKDTILAIAGKPGLYRLVSQGRNMLIVESVDQLKRRIPAGARDRVTSLNDISMYTDDEDKPLMEIFESVKEKENGAPLALTPKKPLLQSLQSSWLPSFPIMTANAFIPRISKNSFSGTTS